jgi:two-component system, cell cycle response regulator DivK
MTRRILIVDDDSRNIFALQAVLRSKEFQCICAGSAAEGISILKDDKNIGIVLMDMMMPEMDGYEAIRMIKGDATLSDVPVIAVTAQAMVGDREKCIAAGADGYLSKPIDVDQLLSMIKQFNRAN